MGIRGSDGLKGATADYSDYFASGASSKRTGQEPSEDDAGHTGGVESSPSRGVVIGFPHDARSTPDEYQSFGFRFGGVEFTARIAVGGEQGKSDFYESYYLQQTQSEREERGYDRPVGVAARVRYFCAKIKAGLQKSIASVRFGVGILKQMNWRQRGTVLVSLCTMLYLVSHLYIELVVMFA